MPVIGNTSFRQFSMILKKRPRSVKVNKYKLKTKKAAQKRYSLVN